MKRLVLIVVAVAALASFTASAQSPQAAAPHAAPTFAKDVAPIMYSKCANCHRPGEVAPMSLLSYEDARPWAKAIKTKVVSREMPPWGADMSQTLPMRNDISLSQKEIETIAAWVDGELLLIRAVPMHGHRRRLLGVLHGVLFSLFGWIQPTTNSAAREAWIRTRCGS